MLSPWDDDQCATHEVIRGLIYEEAEGRQETCNLRTIDNRQ